MKLFLRLGQLGSLRVWVNDLVWTFILVACAIAFLILV